MPNNLFDLTGKSVLVTGGNSGIGLGFARGVAEAGASVCVWGTNPAKNAAALKSLSETGANVIAMQCDVGDRDQVHECFAKTVSELGPIHACFANAGKASSGVPFDQMTLEDWQSTFRVNMEGVFHTLQAAVIHMKEHGQGGSLIATSSGSSLSGAPNSTAYASTKGGVNALMRGLASGFARYGIRANIIVPGWVDTGMTDRFLHTPVFEEKVLKRIPIRRWGVGGDFSGIAVYLSSDASAYHTGDIFVIDGGFEIF